MANQDEGGACLCQFLFKPFNGRQIQMVGWLIQHQNVGFWRQCLGECGAAGFPARQI